MNHLNPIRVVLSALLLVAAGCPGGVIDTGYDGGADADHDASVDCGGVECSPGFTCVDNRCVAQDPCETVVCSNPGEVCSNGVCVSGEVDADDDGVPTRDDCDDTDPAVYPGVERPCTNDCGEGTSLCNEGAIWGPCAFVEDPCELPHAQSSCVDGHCLIDSCDGAWTDCDSTPETGCEAQLGTTEHCSVCGDACASGEICDGGSCRCIPDCGGARCGDGDGCGGICTSGSCPAGSECRDGDCRCIPDCSGAGCGDGDGCGGVCEGWCPPNEDCRSEGCVCPGPHYQHNASGACVSSCGILLADLGLFNDNSGCCASGCALGVTQAGGPGDTWDCNYCCEGNPVGPTCR